MNLRNIVTIIAFLWGISEVVLGITTRAKPGTAEVHDRRSLAVLWTVIVISVVLAEGIGDLPATRIRVRESAIEMAALFLLVSGVTVRWTAITTLGRFFTSNVAIRPEHRLVRTGIYRFTRHPSYTGLLLTFYGLGLSCRNWVSAALIAVPITAAVLYRIRVEEAALTEAFGQEFLEYRKSTPAALFPGLY